MSEDHNVPFFCSFTIYNENSNQKINFLYNLLFIKLKYSPINFFRIIYYFDISLEFSS